jgi:hypothetical protein
MMSEHDDEPSGDWTRVTAENMEALAIKNAAEGRIVAEAFAREHCAIGPDDEDRLELKLDHIELWLIHHNLAELRKGAAALDEDR